MRVVFLYEGHSLSEQIPTFRQQRSQIILLLQTVVAYMKEKQY